MKPIIVVAIVCISTLNSLTSRSQNLPQMKQTENDTLAIQEMLATEGKGWSERDAKLAASVFTTDANWMNAFGRRMTGRAEIEEFLVYLFSHPGEKNTRSADSSETPRQVSIKFLRPDVAVIYNYHEVIGQLNDSGKEMPKRKIHVTKIATKENGKWLIATTVIMDERESLADK